MADRPSPVPEAPACQRSSSIAFGALLLCVTLALPQYASSFKPLTNLWVDATEREVVQIGRYFREISAPGDTICAAHEFPVLAFYAERRTVSLLPIQDAFDAKWRSLMSRPGCFVYFRPAGITEMQSKQFAFRPDPAFAETHREFRIIRELPLAIVYRFEP